MTILPTICTMQTRLSHVFSNEGLARQNKKNNTKHKTLFSALTLQQSYTIVPTMMVDYSGIGIKLHYRLLTGF